MKATVNTPLPAEADGNNSNAVSHETSSIWFSVEHTERTSETPTSPSDRWDMITRREPGAGKEHLENEKNEWVKKCMKPPFISGGPRQVPILSRYLNSSDFQSIDFRQPKEYTFP